MSGARSPAMAGKAPVLLFVYRRADLLPRVMDALERCHGFADHPVIIHSDGARRAEDQPDVDAVRAFVRARLRPNMTLHEQPCNRGLANSIIAGVTTACRTHGAAIVIEDDLVLAPLALAWFQAGLDRFGDHPAVMQISGFAFDVPAIRVQRCGVFMEHPTSWGWAVWERSWALFDAQCAGWEDQLRDPAFRRRFNVGNTQRFEGMMRDQMEGRSDSWAIRWHYSVMRNRGLVLYPPQSMVDNIGRESGNATHGQRTAHLLPFGPLWSEPDLPALPTAPTLSRSAVETYVRRMRWSLFGLALLASKALHQLRRWRKPGNHQGV